MTQKGEAGARGKDVRSDCYVSVELAATGGIQVELQSKVAGLYGNRIREVIGATLKTLGVDHAKIGVEDQGALDWVMMARIEAAVRRAGFEIKQPALPPERAGMRAPTSRDRMRRSRLYLPGNNPKVMINGGLYGGDAMILDLEDAVAPSVKDAARLLVRNALRQLDFGGAERMVRINQGEPGRQDLDEILPQNVHCLLVPKVESADQIRAVDEHIAKRLGKDHGVLLMPIIESARGAWHAFEIASAAPSVVALAIGLEDYTADIGVQRTLEGRESFWARSQVVNGARAAGVQPIDTVFSDVGDMEGLRQSVLEAKALGFEGKGCIHPRQIKVVHDGFAPDAAEIKKATAIVLAFEEAQAKGLGVISLGTKMIDPPVVKRAIKSVELAVAAGKLTPGWRAEQTAKPA
ncbi:MAG: citrate lyase acyl carrier protein [Deltaproteobacteria bacterium]|nr:citrate lyase acyl carrier protein [Deltaproteobacteria bacterium]